MNKMKKRYITVPKDKKAEKSLDYDEAANEQLLEILIEEEDFTKLCQMNLFSTINEINNSNIDDFEDEVINNSYQMIQTIKHLQNKFKLLNDETKDLVDRIINLFEEAVKRKTGIYFFF